MGPLAILSILSTVAPLIAGAIKAEQAVQEGREHVETVRTMEAYRYGPHTPAYRKAFVQAVASRLPKRAAFLAPALLSANSQWKVDITIGLIETEMYR